MIQEIDEIDRQILSILMKDAKTPYTDIAKQLFFSSGTIHVRMKKLEQMGVVKGAVLKVDYASLGYDITAFLGIYLEKSFMFDDAAEALINIPEIVSVHYTTGNYSMFAKIICKNAS